MTTDLIYIATSIDSENGFNSLRGVVSVKSDGGPSITPGLISEHNFLCFIVPTPLLGEAASYDEPYYATTEGNNLYKAIPAV
jgi:hypothetical protein